MSLFDNLEQYRERTAVMDEGGTEYSYGQLLESADAIGAAVGNRTLVFLVCENCYESIAAYVGFLRRRIVPVLINPKIDEHMLSCLLEDYKPQFVFCNKEWHAEGREVFATGGHHLVAIEGNPALEMNPELAVLITTSGSTGSSKLVMQSYKNVYANTASIVEYLHIQPEDRAITTMPMSYTYGLSIIQTHLFVGARMIVTEKTFMEKEFWNVLKSSQATTFGGVPYIYEMLKRLRFGRMDLPSLKYITQAGGKLSKELVAEFVQICKDKGMQFIVMYGQTEATARMSYLPWEWAERKAGSMGIAIPGGKFSIIDDDGKVITEAEVSGELVYEGDNVTIGYAQNRQDLTTPGDCGGILHTGDMAKVDADGFYYIVGRKKRFLKLFGNRVNLDEIEGLLKREGFDCVCGGADDKLKIYIVKADEACMERAVDFISRKVGLNRTAFQAVSIEEIPRNDSGKITYSKLEEMYA